jgi:hypothetical protein
LYINEKQLKKSKPKTICGIAPKDGVFSIPIHVSATLKTALDEKLKTFLEDIFKQP